VHFTVSHFEIPAADLDRAAAFYRRAFGWEAEPLAWAGGPYLRLRSPLAPAPAIRGGLVPRAVSVAAQPLVVLHLHGGTLEEALAEVEAAGGRRELAPTAIGGFGRFACCRDSEGNLLGLWQAATPEGP